MKIHEYQGKQILKKFGVTVPRGIHCTTVDDAVKAAESLGGNIWVVKAQIHAGGRGKGGGVKVAKSLEQVREYAGQILGMQLKTHQTGPEGQKVRHLLIEEGADIKHEYYVAALTDRASQKVVMMASYEGGMDIEEVAHKTPEKIIKVFIDPLTGLTATLLAVTLAQPAVKYTLPLSAGVTLYVAASDLMPEVNHGGGRISIFVFAGIALFYLTHLLLHASLG